MEVPEAYEWSSYNFYTGEKKAPLWLCRDFILAYFDASASAAQRGYKDFVQGLIDDEYASPLAEVTGSLLLGSEDFEIARYDSGLHEPHLDILRPDGSKERTVDYGILEKDQALSVAIQDFKNNWDAYIERWSKWYKERE